MRVDMSRLTIENFSYYAFNPTAPSLSRQDQKIAIIATALLGLTLGLGHLVCAIIYAIKKDDFKSGLAIPTAFRILEHTFQPVNTPQPKFYRNHEDRFFSENERDIRSFERDARKIRDPLLRDGALLAAECGRGLNQLGKSFVSMLG